MEEGSSGEVVVDVSKLPKLSQTPKPEGNEPGGPPESPEPPPPPRHSSEPPVSVGGEAWINIAIGAVVLIMQGRFFKWLSGRGEPLSFTTAQGEIIGYAQSDFFLHDLGLVVFGVALVIDGLLLLFARPWAVTIGLVITLLATLMNLFTFSKAYSVYGVQLLPLLAVVFGVYMAIYQWKLLRLLTTGRSAPMT